MEQRKEQTIKEWLEELPEPYRTQALTNARPDRLTIKRTSITSAIDNAFSWSDSQEGHVYWSKLNNILRK